MNRRHFLRIGMAAGVAVALGRKVARAVAPDPQHYFHAVTHPLPTGKRCYLNGIDVTDQGAACDTRDGWVVMYDKVRHLKDGEIIRVPQLAKPGEPFYEALSPTTRIHFGKVEIR